MIRTLSGWITANKVNKWKRTGGTLFKAFTFDYAKDFDNVEQRPHDFPLILPGVSRDAGFASAPDA